MQIQEQINALIRIEAQQDKQIEEIQSILLQQASLIAAVFTTNTTNILAVGQSKLTDAEKTELVAKQWQFIVDVVNKDLAKNKILIK